MVIESGGSRLLGGVYTPAGGGPHPAVVLLHGLPGNEKNLDLAHALRACGFVVVFFSYRGAWGSEGDFHFDHLIPDTLAALETALARRDVDPRRVALVGISLGGWTALAAAARDARPAAVVAIVPLIDPVAAPIPPGLAEEASAMLHGIGPQAAADQWASLPSLVGLAPDLARQPILLVTADSDAAFPPSTYLPLLAALRQIEWIRFPGADHLLSAVRPGMIHVVTQWLIRAMRPS